MVYLSDHPITLLEEAITVMDSYFDAEYPPNTTSLIEREREDGAWSLSLGAAVLNENNTRASEEPFQMIVSNGMNLAFKLTKPYEHLQYKVYMLDSVIAGTNYKDVIQYLSLHCAIRYHLMPDSITMHSAAMAGEREPISPIISLSAAHPYNKFSVYLNSYLNNFQYVTDISFEAMRQRLNLLLNFITKYCVYVPN